MDPDAVRRVRITWIALIAVCGVPSVLFALMAHAAAAGMTVFGLAAVGLAGAAFYLDHEHIVPMEGITVRVRRWAKVSGSVCAVSTVVTVIQVTAKTNSTLLFVIAFGSAIVLGAIAMYGANR